MGAGAIMDPLRGTQLGASAFFYPDAGLDTGDLLLTRTCNVSINDTVDSQHNNMHPEGVKAMGEAVQMTANDTAVCIKQPEVGATYDAFLNKPELRRVNLDQTAKNIHNFIRGLDSSPGAWVMLEGRQQSCLNPSLLVWDVVPSDVTKVELRSVWPGLRWSRDGLMIQGNDDKWLVANCFC